MLSCAQRASWSRVQVKAGAGVACITAGRARGWRRGPRRRRSPRGPQSPPPRRSRRAVRRRGRDGPVRGQHASASSSRTEMGTSGRLCTRGTGTAASGSLTRSRPGWPVVCPSVGAPWVDVGVTDEARSELRQLLEGISEPRREDGVSAWTSWRTARVAAVKGAAQLLGPEISGTNRGERLGEGSGELVQAATGGLGVPHRCAPSPRHGQLSASSRRGGLQMTVRTGTAARGALHGLRVVDFGQYLAGPLVAMVLADLGADVVRVDPPGGPRWRTDADAVLQRGEPSIVLDLARPVDVDVARGLVDRADVVVEGFRPGVMARLGLGPQESVTRNPGLVYCSLPGFGHDDPRAGVPA